MSYRRRDRLDQWLEEDQSSDEHGRTVRMLGRDTRGDDDSDPDHVETVMMASEDAMALLKDDGEPDPDEESTRLAAAQIGWVDPDDPEDETFLLADDAPDPYMEPSTFDQSLEPPRVDTTAWLGLTVVAAACVAAIILSAAFAIAGLLLL